LKVNEAQKKYLCGKEGVETTMTTLHQPAQGLLIRRPKPATGIPVNFTWFDLFSVPAHARNPPNPWLCRLIHDLVSLQTVSRA
jgi:hypothetical protein